MVAAEEGGMFPLYYFAVLWDGNVLVDGINTNAMLMFVSMIFQSESRVGFFLRLV